MENEMKKLLAIAALAVFAMSSAALAAKKAHNGQVVKHDRFSIKHHPSVNENWDYPLNKPKDESTGGA
jgi:opacity protein-like surface antigen